MGIESIIYLLISIVLLLCFSAFFSAAETGITAASRSKIHRLLVEGNRRARMVKKLREDNKEQMIGAILLGNNGLNVAASAVATSAALKLFGDGGLIYVTVAMTFMVLIFAEVLPKTYAFENSEKVALRVAPVLLLLVKLLYPITWLVQRLVTLTMRLTGIAGKHGDSLISATEALRGAIELHHSEGLVEKDDRNMLQSILDLADREVVEIMTHRRDMTSFNIEEDIDTLVNKILDAPHTRVPLWRDNPDNIVGVLHIKDVFKALKAHKGDIHQLDWTSIAAEPWFIPETTTLQDQLNEFRRRRMHFALVVDEYGALEGLVTLEDILEEIVGEIDDEYDQREQGIVAEVDGSYKVEGTVTIRDLNRELDWNLPDEEATTIAGLVMHETGSIPNVGEYAEFHGISFRILAKEGNRISLIQVRKLPVKKGDDEDEGI